MTNIPLFAADYSRQVAKEPVIRLKNRFLEANPTLSTEPVAAIARPGMKKFAEVGTGPIRKVFSSPGTFNGDLFVVSGEDLYRISSDDLTETFIGTISTTTLGDVSMCTTAPFEATIPAYLYIADGGVLWVYTENGHASAILQAAGAIANGDVVRLNDTYYQWTNASVDAGAPAGTVGNPWLVALGASTTIALVNLYNAVNDTGVAGTDYSTALTAHTTVHATSVTPTDAYFEAIDSGAIGNAYESTETGANISFGGATFSGGGSDQIRQVEMPEDYGAISVAHINSYVIVVPIQIDEIKGRFYWIEPGENTVDVLNFATAERNPDGVLQVVVFGDMFWLLGENTIEPWITTGDPNAPMQRFSGIIWEHGVWEGTGVTIKGDLFLVDENGRVYKNNNPISRPDIEERIRRAIQLEESSGA